MAGDPTTTVNTIDQLITAFTSLGGMGGIIAYFMYRDRETTKRDTEQEKLRQAQESARELAMTNRINSLEEYQRGQLADLVHSCVAAITTFNIHVGRCFKDPENQ